MARPRLTKHQAQVLIRLTRLTKDGRWTAEKNIGCRMALEHLLFKGYAELRWAEPGPRGGERREWRAIP